MIPEQPSTTLLNRDQVAELWQLFTIFDDDGSGAIAAQELGLVLKSLGQSPTQTELREMIEEVDINRSGTIDFTEFQALMLAQQGDRQSRLQLAFSVFDEDNSGRITVNEMRSVMSQFGLTEQELNDMIQEVDHDGDAAIDFAEFCTLVPEEKEPIASYPNTPLPTAPLNTVSTTNSTTKSINVLPAETHLDSVPLAMPPSDRSAVDPEILRLQQLLAQHPQHKKPRGTSRLQMQIGLFRLIQGAAYRCFRESFSANHETHLRVKNLPYTITDFVEFVRMAIDLYKALEIVEPACHQVLDAVTNSITAEFDRLQQRIQNWPTLAKTPEMLTEETVMLQKRQVSATVKEKFAAGVEFAITLNKKRLSFRDVTEGILAINELNRLRKMELNNEFTVPTWPADENPQDYLKQWQRVILTDATEQIDGAMMPVAYWYEDFMPKLLAAFSVSTAADIQAQTVPDPVALQQWYESIKVESEFGSYGLELAEFFPTCTPPQQLILQQAWQLTHHYLNGVQKRRERVEFGRESGALSQYVAFIDLYVQRHDVKNEQMRVSFPYYLGPAVWRFFHTTAEIICLQSTSEQTRLAKLFKEFFQRFAALYPCPYCRHHLNMYVVQNKEVGMYPVEYLLLGRDPHITHFEVSMEAKLATVVDGTSLRLFFWKLHNTVSSSIARSEEWYHQDQQALYTTRFWPSLDAELARAQALQHISIDIDRIRRLYGTLKPASRLAGVKATLAELIEIGDEESISETCIIAQNYIKELEEALLLGGFLPETYSFDPDLVDQVPTFTPAEEAFARSGAFVETI
jgi:Ca2+-binding EF-hand superfamily protein